MRRILISIFFLLTGFISFCQSSTRDSLTRLLTGTKYDSARIELLNKLANIYVESKPDSVLLYAKPALELARKTNNKQGEISALRNICGALLLSGNYSTALETALEALKKSEQIENRQQIANCQVLISAIYGFQGDDHQSRLYSIKAKNVYREINDMQGLTNVLINLGNYYRVVNQLDSARICQNEALEISLRENDMGNASAAWLNLGIIGLKMKQYGLATSYCKLGIPYFKTQNNHLFLSSIYYFLSVSYDSTGRIDSAFYYGRLAYNHAKEMAAPVMILPVAKQLVSLFKKNRQVDSSFYYQELAMTANDSLTSQEKQKQLQMLTFNEELRQMKLEEQRRNQAEDRKHNLQLTAIAIFIPLFLFAVLLIGRRKVRSRTVEFLGILSLLFLFEFTVLLVHPYIGHWTHESPVWMLLILVAIAVVLVPLHHRSEKWMKKKLATRPVIKVKHEEPETQES